MHRFLTLAICLQAVWLCAQAEHRHGHSIICSAGPDTLQAFMPPPAAFLNGEAEVMTPFILTFTDSVPDNARETMQYAADIWGSYLMSDVPVRVEVDWRDQGDDRQLAGAGPSIFFRSFSRRVDPNIWYPVALAEAILGDTLNANDEPDINVVVNSMANWHFDTDRRAPRNRIDLATVFLHELGHGLGFLSSIDSTSDTTLSIGLENRFIIYDLFLQAPTDRLLSDPELFPSPGTELLEAVVDILEFGGDSAVARNDGELVPLFAPITFDVGSSVSHLDEGAYRGGSENALMTPFVANGEVVHDPGPSSLGILFDLGWPLRFDLPVSTRPPVVAGQLDIFPNPARNFVGLQLEKLYRPGPAVLYDAAGRRVREFTLVGERPSLDVHDLPSGLYTLTVPDLNDGRVYSGRLVIGR